MNKTNLFYFEIDYRNSMVEGEVSDRNAENKSFFIIRIDPLCDQSFNWASSLISPNTV